MINQFTTQFKVKTLFLFLLTFSLFGCLSETEKQERRDDAFDLSGYYNTSAKAGNKVDMAFTIINLEGRHKIKAVFNRKSPLLKSEIDVLKAYDIDINAVKNLIMSTDLVFSRGGDDNVSTDNGKTSSFTLYSEKTVTDTSVRGYDKAVIEYRLAGTVTKPITEMTGKLSLSISLTRARKDEDDYNTFTTEGTSIPFTTDFKNGFHTQYMGRWAGNIHSTDDKYISQIVGVEFSKSGNKYVVRPLYREMTPAGVKEVPKDVIVYNGENFTFLKVEDNLDELDTTDFPMIRSVYKNKKTNNRIILIGTIWSLGDFSGNILLITKNSQEKVGSFQFVKKQ